MAIIHRAVDMIRERLTASRTGLNRSLSRLSALAPDFQGMMSMSNTEPQWRAEDQSPGRQTPKEGRGKYR